MIWVLVGLLAGGLDDAQGGRQWELRWTAPPSCASAVELTAAVEARLGRRVFAVPASHRVEGRIDRSEGLWRASITISDQTGTQLGTREVLSEEPTCDSMTARLALVLSLVVDPAATSAPVEASTQPAAAPELPAPKVAPTPDPDALERVRVDWESDRPEARLYRIVLDGTSRVQGLGNSPVFGAALLCGPPCGVWVPVGTRLFIGGPNLVRSDVFDLPRAPAVKLTSTAGDVGSLTGGMVLAGVGINLLLGGGAMLLVAALGRNPSDLLIWGGVGAAVGGAGATAYGLHLIGQGQTRYTVTARQ